MRWVEYVECMGEMKNTYSILVGKLEGTRSLGRPRNRWEDNIRIGLKGLAWIHLAQDRDHWRAVVNTVTKGGEFLD
jgi:hypothetical protein